MEEKEIMAQSVMLPDGRRLDEVLDELIEKVKSIETALTAEGGE